jgi:hypothetical protein
MLRVEAAMMHAGSQCFALHTTRRHTRSEPSTADSDRPAGSELLPLSSTFPLPSLHISQWSVLFQPKTCAVRSASAVLLTVSC